MENNKMPTDVKIKTNGMRFKFRVAGIVEYKNQILLVKMNQNPFYCFPGGHVELLEETAKAVERELNEELYFDVEVGDLLYIHENFFNVENDKFHELCFYFKATPKDKDFKPYDKVHEELDKEGWVHHEYKWFDKSELVNLGAQPKLIMKNYVEDSNKFMHLVTDDIRENK